MCYNFGNLLLVILSISKRVFPNLQNEISQFHFVQSYSDYTNGYIWEVLRSCKKPNLTVTL